LPRKLAAEFPANAPDKGETAGPLAASGQRVFPGKMAIEVIPVTRVDPVSAVLLA